MLVRGAEGLGAADITASSYAHALSRPARERLGIWGGLRAVIRQAGTR
jgi:hypothetical protein